MSENTMRPNSRMRLMLMVTGIFVLIGASYAFYWFTFARYSITTDNAYVSGNIIQITPQTSGSVAAVFVNDTDFVKAGTVLVSLDRADAETALEQAEAELARTVRQVRSLYTSDSRLKAVVKQKETALKKAQDDLDRRMKLSGTGAIAQEEIDHAGEAVKLAQQSLEEAHEQFKTSRSLTERTVAESHPDVEKAAAQVRESYLALKRTEIVAPEDGFVARRNVQKGQWVNTGAPLMAIVPLDQIWVDANFKETQLRNMRIGQPVELSSDLLGSGVKYKGVIQGFSAGTGSAFSLLPAQNATGNWIKVVQRLAVRVALDKKEIKENPLQIGLSMEARVNVRDNSGKRFTGGVSAHDSVKPAYKNTWKSEADAVVSGIIARNR
ncbi:efflux RND transporter periplasmic adaptor subunit [Seleniivibrio sp.]|uniref:efflux RND transporter periplasmic adaptor subunit n=1 Tax=Seleniivibrio sp. TaxID=2898801 RepID=UPI0025DC7994|nr:efflux RND transporter periplasmic adaptor subunit [Seleniivibrio sp.]MCD8552505.1 HlyD family efflux transporter periplasmic adaptor subunit [Seleniivibrio sp.]